VLCERCHKSLATLKYTEVVNGTAHERNICEQCLTALQGDGGSGFEVSGSAPAPKRRRAAESNVDVVRSGAACTTCGASLREILKSGRVGCHDCYEQFYDEIEPLLVSRHTALRHRGKAPHHDEDRAKYRHELQSKRALLRSALKMESYEEAAVLRDEIRTLEASLGTASQESE